MQRGTKRKRSLPQPRKGKAVVRALSEKETNAIPSVGTTTPCTASTPRPALALTSGPAWTRIDEAKQIPGGVRPLQTEAQCDGCQHVFYGNKARDLTVVLRDGIRRLCDACHVPVAAAASVSCTQCEAKMDASLAMEITSEFIKTMQSYCRLANVSSPLSGLWCPQCCRMFQCRFGTCNAFLPAVPHPKCPWACENCRSLRVLRCTCKEAQCPACHGKCVVYTVHEPVSAVVFRSVVPARTTTLAAQDFFSAYAVAQGPSLRPWSMPPTLWSRLAHVMSSPWRNAQDQPDRGWPWACSQTEVMNLATLCVVQEVHGTMHIRCLQCVQLCSECGVLVPHEAVRYACLACRMPYCETCAPTCIEVSCPSCPRCQVPLPPLESLAPSAEPFSGKGVEEPSSYSFEKGVEETSSHSFEKSGEETSSHSFEKGGEEPSSYSFEKGVEELSSHSFEKSGEETSSHSFETSEEASSLPLAPGNPLHPLLASSSSMPFPGDFALASSSYVSMQDDQGM
jgi:hypothetical protein